MSRLCLFAFALCLAFAPLRLTAQSEADVEPIFDNYLTLRATLDSMMKNRDIAEVMLAFGAGDEMDAAELEDLESRVRSIYPRDFLNVKLMRKTEHEAGFRQELIVFWEDVNYIYVYLLLHQRDDGLVSINMNFNSDFDALNEKF